MSNQQPLKVTLIGSGNWGSAVACLIGGNAKQYDTFDDCVRMYVYEEEIEHQGQTRKLSEVINETNENVKYLAGVKLPENIMAVPNLTDAVKDSELLIWCVPHQFVGRMIPEVKKAMAEEAMSISLIKGGVDIKDGKMELCSDLIKQQLGTDCSVLMGANIANEVAAGNFCEATVGYRSQSNAETWQLLFQTQTFAVNIVEDVPSVELCGALKNIVALGAGFCDGMGFGSNTKAAVMRIGLVEMKNLIKKFYPDSQDSTFFESCGVADLITTCFGGRNRKCAEIFAKNGGEKCWEEIEKEELNGQKLQGTLTSTEIQTVLEKNNCVKEFPFFNAIYQISFKQAPTPTLFEELVPILPKAAKLRRISTGTTLAGVGSPEPSILGDFH